MPSWVVWCVWTVAVGAIRLSICGSRNITVGAIDHIAIAGRTHYCGGRRSGRANCRFRTVCGYETSLQREEGLVRSIAGSRMYTGMRRRCKEENWIFRFLDFFPESRVWRNKGA